MRSVLMIALLYPAVALAADGRLSVAQHMTERFRREFKFDASLARVETEQDAATSEPDGEVLVLPTVIVQSRYHGAAAAIEEAKLRAGEESFTWGHGGTIVKGRGGWLSPDIKFKYNPLHNGIDLLNFSF